MRKFLRKYVLLFAITILIVIAIISTFFVVKDFRNKSKINDVLEKYTNEEIKKQLSDENSNVDDLLLKIDDKTALGIIKIEKIGFEGIVYEGTDLETLKKGVGHFENSPYFDGNICLAAHNYKKFWAELHNLQSGDIVTYTTFLGTRRYMVNNVTNISESDWSLLENTNENFLTLITCIKGKKEQRLCVRAIEIK